MPNLFELIIDKIIMFECGYKDVNKYKRTIFL